MKLDINIARIADFIGRHITNVPFLEGGVPPFASIEFSNNALCNRRCIFCPRVNSTLFPNKNEHLSYDLFQKTMKELAAVDYSGRISFSGFCEPLLTKDLEKYIALGKKTCHKMTIEISSNGDILTKDRMKSLFDAGLDNIRISLYEGPHQNEIFMKIKNELNLNDKQVIVRSRYLSAEQSYGLTISNRAGAVTLNNESIRIEPLKEPLKQPCYYPFYKMLVDYNGDVLICSNDWLKNLIVGNLHGQTVYEVWNGHKFNEARIRLMRHDRSFAPCDICDVNGIYNGGIHFQAWIQYYQKQGIE